jgi:hypothetical protein
MFLYSAIYVFTWVAGAIDYSRIASDKEPIFASPISVTEDGGSAVYRGVGYTVGTMRRMYPSVGNSPGLQDYGAWIKYQWKPMFPELRWVRSDLRFQVERIRQ